ncbi:Gfo/Idh/MocA family protein [Planktotalea sp.]|uniref:Gfo/Idh/MocA family protein n=1 Tax=Planktotalea sp. TaxID=2029877 RepID=UPI003F6A77AF
MGTTRWGILGAAKFAREHMGPAIAAAQGGELVALATSDALKAVPFQKFAPNLKVHTDYDALLADPNVDAVYIPLPNDLHQPWALKALAAGKAVLVEKPIGMNVAEIDELIAARDASGLLAAEAYMIVHHPQWQKMRELVQSGALGRLRRVSSTFSYDNRADESNIRHSAARGGGGLRDIGVYTLGGARFVTGQEPKRIISKQLTLEHGVDVHALVTAEFDDFTYDSTTSMRMTPYQCAEFHGEDAIARLSVPYNPLVYGEARLEVLKKDGSSEVFRWPSANHYVLQVEAFQRAMQGESYGCPLEFSRGTQAMLDEILA